jgi:hypothetical protein
VAAVNANVFNTPRRPATIFMAIISYLPCLADRSGRFSRPMNLLRRIDRRRR